MVKLWAWVAWLTAGPCRHCGLSVSTEMVGCWAVYCANQSKDGYLLHRFPKEAVRRAAWKEACNRIDKQPSATSRLCEVSGIVCELYSTNMQKIKLIEQS